MKSFHTNESRAADALLNGSLSETDEDDAAFSDEALRSARIDEYQQQSLHADDPLEASLGALTGGLLRFAQCYERTSTELLDSTSGAIHGSPELQRAMNTYLNLARQTERNVNLMNRLAEDRRHGANIKPQRRQAIVPGSISEISRRNKR
jgi:hypothetical protein